MIVKAVIHPSGDQDDTGRTYIRPNWPEIRYGNGGGAAGAWLSYNAQSSAADADRIYYSTEWREQRHLQRLADARRHRRPHDHRIPADSKPGDTIHIIAEATDDGTLSLTRYARAVVTVK